MMKSINSLSKLTGKFVLVLLVLFSLFLLTNSHDTQRVSAAGYRYVSPTGSDEGDCSSGNAACRTLQYTINQAASGDTIFVAEGTYTYSPPTYDPCPDWMDSVLCFVNKNLTIMGGYSDSNWTVRDPANNPTVIDGQNAHRGIVVIGWNSPQVFYLTLDGFTIRKGHAQGPTGSFSGGLGGGIFVQNAAINLSNVAIENSKVYGKNTSSGDGGPAFGGGLAIDVSPSGAVSTFRNVRFENNESYGGTGPDRGGISFGALFVNKAKVVVEDGIFRNNYAQAGNSTGSGISKSNGLPADAIGGGIGLQNGSLTLRRITLTGNKVQGGNASANGGSGIGAAIFAEGLGSYTSSMSLTDSYVADNVALGGNAVEGGIAVGGGISTVNTHIRLERVKVVGNSAIGGNTTSSGLSGLGTGGGLYLVAMRSGVPDAVLNNIIVADNFANQGEGDHTAGNGGGGGMAFHGLGGKISHATIAGNRLPAPLVLGEGLLVQPWPSASGSIPANISVENSIIAIHPEGAELSAAVVVQVGSSLTFNNGMFAQNLRDTNIYGNPVRVGTINGLDTMVSESSVDFISPGSPNYNYYLHIDSSAKDRSTSSTIADDVVGQQRPYGNGYDFGAYEYWPLSVATSPGDRILQLDWSQGADMLVGGVDFYQVELNCPPGAAPPDQGGCDRPIDMGSSTSITLTGLTNGSEYGVTIRAYGPNENLITSSEYNTVMPTDILVYIPIITR